MLMWLPRYLRLRWDLRKVKLEEQKLNKHILDTNSDVEAYVRWQDNVYEWRQMVLTTYWVSKAESFAIELPSWSKETHGRVDWENDESQPWYLHPEGISIVRAAVREEQKHRREAYAFWVTGVLGLIGAATGFLAVYKA
jgi:hypothetical protein